MKIKKYLCALLAISTIFSLSACSGNSSGSSSSGTSSADVSSEDPFLTGEKPELNVLTYYTTFDMSSQPSVAVSEELTGYKVNWFNLPQEQATEKLLLEVAGGTSYDLLVRLGLDQITQLESKGGLLELSSYLDKYGDNIMKAVPDINWTATTGTDGKVFGIPIGTYDTPNSKDNLYGIIKYGLAYRSDVLADLGIDVPETLDDFYNALVAYKNKTGKAGFTTSSGAFYSQILSAFGMGDSGWYDIDGVYTPRIKVPAMVDYLAFMQKLYKEGLYDEDMPVNTGSTFKEKFSNATAFCAPLAFFDIPSMIEAVKTSNPDCEMAFGTPLAPDDSTNGVLYVSQGCGAIAAIPKTAKNPEHAIIWFNKLSETDTFKAIYIGEENVTYEIKDNKYYPIFPAFNDFQNSDKFPGVACDGVVDMWQARARKTDEMAIAYDDMNSRIDNYDVEFFYTSFASSLEANMEYSAALATMMNDALITAIVDGSDAQAAINNIIAKWDAEGGKEMEAEMQTWYDANKSMFVQ